MPRGKRGSLENLLSCRFGEIRLRLVACAGKSTATHPSSSLPIAFGLVESFKRRNELSWNKIDGWALEGGSSLSGGE